MNANELFEEKQNLVFYAIKQHFGSFSKAARVAEINNMELDDFIQIGKLVIWNLCLNFDPNREETFNSYIVKSVKWKISFELHLRGLPIKVNTNISAEKRNSLCFHSTDLYRNDGETENEFFAIAPTDVEKEVLISIEIEEALSILNHEEKFILIQKSFGLSDQEVSKIIGKSRPVINRIKNAAYKKINPNYKPMVV